jgi:hypothetical protein
MTYLHRLALATVAIAGSITTSARAAEPDILLPATTDSVIQINVRQILESDIVKKYAVEQLKQALDSQDVKKLLTEIGLDPLKDLDQVVVGTSGSNKADMKLLVILHGKFTPEKLFKAAEAQSKKEPEKFDMIKDGSTIMFKYQPDNSDTPIFGTVVDEKTVIAATDQKMITAALAASKGKKAAPLSKELTSLVKKMDDKSSVFAASILKGKFDEVKIPGNGLPIDLSSFQSLLPKIETLAFSVRVKTDVHVEVTLGMKDEDSSGEFSKAIEDLLKQLKPLAQLAAAAEPRAKPLGDILGTVKTETQSKEVVITGKITGVNIGKMVNPND